MQVIWYLFYCIASAVSVACGNGGGRTIDNIIGLICILILVGLFVGITSLIAILKKRRKKKKGEEKKDFLNKK